jgi:hypothetical protein
MQLLQAQANVKGRRRYGMGLFDSLTGTKCPPKGTPVLSPQAVQNRLLSPNRPRPGTDTATDFTASQGDTKDGTLETVVAAAAATEAEGVSAEEQVTPETADSEQQATEEDAIREEQTNRVFLPLVTQ